MEVVVETVESGHIGWRKGVFVVDVGSTIANVCEKVEESVLTKSGESVKVRSVFELSNGVPSQALSFQHKITNNRHVSVILESHNTQHDTMQNTKIPITILTGFLGAGKTTLLNHILLHQKHLRIAVIENEFGEIAIDRELLPDQTSGIKTAEQVVVLDNGCMCCTVRGDLLGAFKSISAKMKEGNSIDAVLIETTGLANPVPIARTITTTPFITSEFELNGVLTLVDTKNTLERLEEAAGTTNGDEKLSDLEDNEVIQQIVFADKIVLSKVDSVDAAVVLQVREKIKALNNNAPVLSCVRGRLDPREITGLRSERLHTTTPHSHSHSHSHSHGHGHSHSDGCCSEVTAQHTQHVKSFSVVRSMKCDVLYFLHWMRQLAKLKKEKGVLYRAKGVVLCAGEKSPIVFHAVMDVLEKQYIDASKDDSSRLVFIGKDLDQAFITESFDSTLCTNTTPTQQISPSEQHTLLCNASILATSLLGSIVDWLDNTRDVVRLGLSCKSVFNQVFVDGIRHTTTQQSSVHHRSNKFCDLHRLGVSMSFVKTYWNAMRQAKLDVVPLSGLVLNSREEAEACGITWLEVCKLDDEDTYNFAVDFSWRGSTVDTFFGDEAVGISSKMERIEIPYTDEYGDEEFDKMKLKIKLRPIPTQPNQLQQYNIALQITGGRSLRQSYVMSVHSIDPHFQFHLNIEDCRMPMVQHDTAFHQHHPLLHCLRKQNRVRTLIRVKLKEKGLLEDMCGCC